MTKHPDQFTLFDLRVVVEGDPESFVCGHAAGDHFLVEGEMLHFPDRQGFSLYSLAALLPLLPAKQRQTDANDWMSTDDLIACPDPNCGARFRISRTGQRTFRHSEVTVAPPADM